MYEVEAVLLSMLLSLCIMYTLFWIASYLTLKSQYKYYKKTYNAIQSKDYTFLVKGNQIIFVKKDNMNLYPSYPPIYPQEIIFSQDTKGISLIKGYIHYSMVTFFDPYSIYWYYKIKKIIFENSKSIQEIREEKLKLLKIK